MGPDEGKAGAVVLLDLADRPPGLFLVALGAPRAELSEVNVLVTTCTALRLEDGNGAAVVVAAKARRVTVRAFQRHARLCSVIELEVLDQRIP
jgi:hypothetical protein